MRKCPFCNKEVEMRFPFLSYIKGLDQWSFSHHCEMTGGVLDVCIDIYGATEQEVIDKWNGCGKSE